MYILRCSFLDVGCFVPFVLTPNLNSSNKILKWISWVRNEKQIVYVSNCSKLDGWISIFHQLHTPNELKGFYYWWLFSFWNSKVSIKLSSIDPILSKIIIILYTNAQTFTKLVVRDIESVEMNWDNVYKKLK